MKASEDLNRWVNAWKCKNFETNRYSVWFVSWRVLRCEGFFCTLQKVFSHHSIFLVFKWKVQIFFIIYFFCFLDLSFPFPSHSHSNSCNFHRWWTPYTIDANTSTVPNTLWFRSSSTITYFQILNASYRIDKRKNHWQHCNDNSKPRSRHLSISKKGHIANRGNSS